MIVFLFMFIVTEMLITVLNICTEDELKAAETSSFPGSFAIYYSNEMCVY